MNLLDTIKERNKKISRQYAGTWRYWMRSPSNMLLRDATDTALAKYSKGGKVLDAGAGKLAYRALVSKHFDEYTSSDFDKTHEELDVVTDIEDMPFQDNEFDFIFCSQVLEHVPHPWKALAEMKRVVKPGGKILITVPLLGYIHNAPYDFFRYTNFGLRSLAEDNQLEVIEIKPLGGLFTFAGYVWSTILTALYSIPLFGDLLLIANYPFSKLVILADKLVPGSEKIFSLNYIAIFEKK